MRYIKNFIMYWGRTILKLIEPTSGSIFFEDTDTSKASGVSLKKLRNKMSIVFQDPFSSLNSRLPIETSLARPLVINGVKKEMINSIIKEVMQKVNLGEELLFRYPHQLSGGPLTPKNKEMFEAEWIEISQDKLNHWSHFSDFAVDLEKLKNQPTLFHW